MSTKTIIGGLIGGVAFFVMGFLLYGLLLGDMMGDYNTSMRPHGEEMMLHLVLGNIVFGFLISWLWSRMGVNNFSKGLSSGAIVGLLVSIASNLIMYATTTIWSAPTGMIYDVIALTVMWGVVGGVVGWWFGRK